MSKQKRATCMTSIESRRESNVASSLPDAANARCIGILFNIKNWHTMQSCLMSFIKSPRRCRPAGTYVSASSISDSQSQLSNWGIFISNYSLIIFWTFIYSPIYLDVQTWELEQFTKRTSSCITEWVRSKGVSYSIFSFRFQRTRQ